MKFLQYLGPIIELIGAAILIVTGFQSTRQDNTMLVVGMVIVVVGFVFHIIANKRIVPLREDDK